jgi:hypothetical protein
MPRAHETLVPYPGGDSAWSSAVTLARSASRLPYHTASTAGTCIPLFGAFAMYQGCPGSVVCFRPDYPGSTKGSGSV